MSPGRTILSAPPLVVDLADQRTFLDGVPIELGPKPFALLVTLMQAPQRLVTKEELFESVWEGRFVTEAVLTTAMRDLRKALGDDARAPTFIGTAHGRGYRFLKAVVVEERSGAAPQPAPMAPTRLARPPGALLPVPLVMAGLFLIAIAVLASLAVLSSPPRPEARHVSIAVLPFSDLASVEGRSAFSESVAEEVLDALADVDRLTVAPRTLSFGYRDRGTAAPSDIARALDVEYLLTGSLRVGDGGLRVEVHLLDGPTGRETWTRVYERPLSVQNLFAIQEDIAQSVTRELRVELDVDEDNEVAGTENLQAYDYYLRARELFIARSDLPRAVNLARAATEEDAQFAEAWELLAAATFAAEGGRVTPEAETAVATALRLNPNLSLAHAIRGVMGNINPPYDWDAAIEDLERAIELDPRNATAHLWLGTEMHKLGYLERAQALLERCLVLDPAYDRCREHLIWVLHMRGETDRAIAEHRTQIRNGAHVDDTTLLSAFLARGLEGEARAVTASVASDTPMPSVVFESMRPNARVNRDTARQALRGWIEHVRFRRDIYSVILSLEAYDLLYAEQGSNFGLWFPEHTAFRRSEAFRSFVRTMRLDAYWRAHGFPPQCRAVGASDFSCT